MAVYDWFDMIFIPLFNMCKAIKLTYLPINILLHFIMSIFYSFSVRIGN